MANFGFQDCVEQSFGFLVRDLGFTCMECGPNRVRFESPTVYVELLFDDKRSYELSLYVGRKSVEKCEGLPFSLDEILRLRHVSEAKRFSLTQVTTPEMLAVWVAEFAEVLQAYGIEFLTGDVAVYASLQEQRRLEIEGYALERDLRTARKEAEIAWQRKDYQATVRALKPFRNALTTSEIRKLAYAENRSVQCVIDDGS